MRVEQECHDLKTDQSRELERLRTGILDSLDGRNESFQQLTSAQLDISRQLEQLQSMITTIPIQHRILRHLLPDEIGSRRDQILEADPDTCRWILEPIEGDQGYRIQIRDKFISWLRTGSDVLHISGNPGAGKSTLMKFIGGNPRTQGELSAWAGNRQLIFGQFYFWTAGTEAQRTLPGMFRSLLFQVLVQHPSLIEHVFPRQLRLMKASRFQSDPSVEKFQDFGNTQIQEAFDLFLKKTDNSYHRICFLIDGLDEFQGGDLDHEDLAARLKDWTAGGNIKLLVSSRPWRPFLTMFTAHETLHLHKLNRFDIETYAIRQLKNDREIRRIGVGRMKETITDIVEELVCRAQGIFLWAHLVIDTIRQGIRRRYSIELLKASLREYPSDLDGLYDALREPIEKNKVDRKLSNRMLLLAAAAPEGFTLSAMAFSWLPEDDQSGLLDPNFPPSTECQPYSEEDVVERLQCVTERVNGLTRGLLEISLAEIPRAQAASGEVRFCHRTARDYLVTNAKRYAILEEAWPQFRQSDTYGRIYLAELIYAGISEDYTVQNYLKKPFCSSFSLDTIRKFEVPLRPLLHPRLRWGQFVPREKSHTETVSLLQYAAFCRLDQFVLSEIANSPSAYLQSSGTSILLTSIYSALDEEKSWELAFNLPRSYVSEHNIVDAYVQYGFGDWNPTTSLPIWVIASILSLDELVTALNLHLFALTRKRNIQGKIARGSLVKVCRLLKELGIVPGRKIFVTVGLMAGLHFKNDNEEEYSYFDGTKITFSTDQLLELVDNLNSGIGDLHGDEGLKGDQAPSTTTSGWVLDTVRGMVEQLKSHSSGYTDIHRYRIASWKLDGSSTVSAEERYLPFNFRLF